MNHILKSGVSLHVIDREVLGLKPARRNARTHSAKQIAQLAASINQFGFVNPVLLDAKGRVVAGHGRLAAARQLGMTSVPTIALTHLAPAELRAFALADNRLAELAGWDEALLKLELKELTELDLGFETEITGFDGAVLDKLLLDPDDPTDDPDDVVEDAEAGAAAVTRLGDVWRLGDHRLVCGDARSEVSYRALMGMETAQMIFADPPYNIRIQDNVSGNGRFSHGDFAMASGEMNAAEFTSFLSETLGLAAKACADGAIAYACIDWRHIDEMSAAGKTAFDELKNLIVWAKPNAGQGAFYRSQHELIFVFKKGRKPHINQFKLGETGRYRTNVWSYAAPNGFQADRQDQLSMHPTAKPVAMVVDAIRDVTKRGQIVLDPFGGSGTTLIAAERTGRVARLIEISPAYCDVILKRFMRARGVQPVLEATGQSFADVAAWRTAISLPAVVSS